MIEEKKTVVVASPEEEERRVADEEGDGARPGAKDTVRPREPDPDETGAARSTPLLSDADAAELRELWHDLQVRFVDAPQDAVAEADRLVGRVVDLVTERFARERGDLEEQWDRGDEVSTEALRIALRRYRFFFDRLLAV